MDKPREFWIIDRPYKLISGKRYWNKTYEDSDVASDKKKIHVIEFSAYKKLEDEFKLVRDIGVEMQRECNRKLSLENKKLEEKLKVAVGKLTKFADYENPNEPNRVCYPFNEYMRESREALAAIRDEGK